MSSYVHTKRARTDLSQAVGRRDEDFGAGTTSTGHLVS